MMSMTSWWAAKAVDWLVEVARSVFCLVGFVCFYVFFCFVSLFD